MDDLGPERRPDRRDRRLEPVQDALRRDRRWRSSRIEPSSSRDRAACWTSHSIVRCGGGVEEAAQRPTEARRHLAPAPPRAASDRSSASIRARPGSTRIHPHVVRAVVRARRSRAARPGPRSPGTAPGHEPRDGQRQLRIDARGVEDRQRLHVERRWVLGGVRHLHDRQRRVVGAEQQERLVALAAEVPRGGCLDIEGLPGDVDGGGRIERRAGGGEDGVHGQRMVAARMGASSRHECGPSAPAQRTEPRSPPTT